MVIQVLQSLRLRAQTVPFYLALQSCHARPASKLVNLIECFEDKDAEKVCQPKKQTKKLVKSKRQRYKNGLNCATFSATLKSHEATLKTRQPWSGDEATFPEADDDDVFRAKSRARHPGVASRPTPKKIETQVKKQPHDQTFLFLTVSSGKQHHVSFHGQRGLRRRRRAVGWGGQGQADQEERWVAFWEKADNTVVEKNRILQENRPFCDVPILFFAFFSPAQMLSSDEEDDDEEDEEKAKEEMKGFIAVSRYLDIFSPWK